MEEFTAPQARRLEHGLEESHHKVTELFQVLFLLVVLVFLELGKRGNDNVGMLFEQMLPQGQEVLESAFNHPGLAFFELRRLNCEVWIGSLERTLKQAFEASVRKSYLHKFRTDSLILMFELLNFNA